MGSASHPALEGQAAARCQPPQPSLPLRPPAHANWHCRGAMWLVMPALHPHGPTPPHPTLNKEQQHKASSSSPVLNNAGLVGREEELHVINEAKGWGLQAA